MALTLLLARGELHIVPDQAWQGMGSLPEGLPKLAATRRDGRESLLPGRGYWGQEMEESMKGFV